MIRFGPSGIPLSCKGRTLRDGIEDVHNLGLTALEVQLVRVNLKERYAGDDEVGRKPKDIGGELVIQVGRREGRKETVVSKWDSPIEKGDVLYSLASGVAPDFHELKELGTIARELDIELSLHTPYYMDLADVDGLAARSIDAIKWGSLLADALGGTVVVTHLGLYGGLEPSVATERIAENLRAVKAWFRANRIKAKLGIEASGRQEVVGGLDELLSLSKTLRTVVPVLNFAHLHAREGGSLKRPEDFEEVLAKVKRYVGPQVHAHFSGVEHEGGNELRYTPIKKGDLRFEPLAECLLEDGHDLTLISSSPLLEHDAMYMKVILERVLAKKIARPGREARK